jgi:hypothetical protein
VCIGQCSGLVSGITGLEDTATDVVEEVLGVTNACEVCKSSINSPPSYFYLALLLFARKEGEV